ncbi:protein rpi-1-like [Nilaparvata lugens]|uniref:protein rpi-1-like n=1 Tax=Nilaparvata lugens TaxID=108931 RepID=UPI00193E919C|nr:protein rpi-1-like [Nilaparvata lugens]
MTSPSTSSPSYILPDSPPQRMLNYWQQQKARSSAATSAATAAASAVSPASSSASPLKRQEIYVQRERGEEIVIPDSPLPQSTPATWAPRRAVLTMLSNNIKQKQGKRRLVFDEPEVSGDEEEQSICSQTKKRAGMDESSSMVPLMKEVRRREEEEEEEEEEEDEMEFVSIVNAPTPKPWIPLRELKERTPYPIVGAREQTNIHG